MSRASKTSKRINFLEAIIKIMREHEALGKGQSRKGINESHIQKNVFSKLNTHLPNIIKDNYGLNEKKAKSLVETEFVYESKTTVSVNGFHFFETNHRPDAVLSIDELRVAFEIKKGDNGLAIRSGIGQSVVYSSQFDFCIYFFVDTTPGGDIKNSISGEKESSLIETLWDYHNIKFFVV